MHALPAVGRCLRPDLPGACRTAGGGSAARAGTRARELTPAAGQPRRNGSEPGLRATSESAWPTGQLQRSAAGGLQPAQRVAGIRGTAAFDLGPGQHATTGAGAVLVAAAAADAAGLDACPCLADAEPVLGIALADRGPALFLRFVALGQ